MEALFARARQRTSTSEELFSRIILHIWSEIWRWCRKCVQTQVVTKAGRDWLGLINCVAAEAGRDRLGNWVAYLLLLLFVQHLSVFGNKLRSLSGSS